MRRWIVSCLIVVAASAAVPSLAAATPAAVTPDAAAVTPDAAAVTPDAAAASPDAAAAPSPIPPQLQPALELVSPTLSPVCGDSGLAVVLLPVLLKGVTIPPGVLTLFGPVIEVCGAVPVPRGGYTCALDTDAYNVLRQLTATAAGVPLPINPKLASTGIQQVAYIENQVTPDATLHLAPTIATAIQCASTALLTTTPTTTVPVGSPTPPVSAAPAVLPSTTPATAAPPAVGVPASTAPAVTSQAPVPPAQPAQLVSPTVASTGGFQYPAILLLPLVLLIVVGFIINAFTRPLSRRGR